MMQQQQQQSNMPFQKDMSLGWKWMLLYWSIGAAVGHTSGYIESLPRKRDHSITLFHAAALMTTVYARLSLNPRYGSFGRRPDPLGILVFGIMNGIFETFLFLFAYDIGRRTLAEESLRWKPNSPASCFLGFFIYYVYAGLIHVWFWGPRAFPQHQKPNAPFFPIHALPYLIALSVSWLTLYEQTNDVFFVCLCHSISDLWIAWHCAMPFTRWNENGVYRDEKQR